MTKTDPQQQIETRVFAALNALTRKDVMPWSELFTDDGVQEFPYAPEGSPKQVSGKSAIASYLADYPKMLDLHHISMPTWYHDGNTAIAQFEVVGTAVPTGKPYNQSYISVIEHEGGKIVRYIDYWNPLIVQEALGSMFK